MATVRTVCTPNCCNTCGLLAHVEGGRIVRVEPASFPEPRYTRICLKGLASLERQYHPERLTHPLRRAGDRGSGKWERVSWDAALDDIAARLKDIAERHGSRSVAFATLTGTYAILSTNAANRFASVFGGSVPTRGTIMGDRAGITGMALTLGRVTSHEPEDWANSRFIILWGYNPAETLMNSFRFILEAREKGARVVAIDPRFTPTAAQCDEWISIRPGTDTALALGMMRVILQEGLYDREFVSRHTVAPFLVRSDNGQFLRDQAGRPLGWDLSLDRAVPVEEAGDPGLPHPRPLSESGEGSSYPRPLSARGEGGFSLMGSYVVDGITCSPAFQKLASLADEYPLEKASAVTGVPAGAILRLARDYAATSPAALILGWGAQRYFNGHQPFRAAATLAALTGNLGVSGGGASHFFLWPMHSLFDYSSFTFPEGQRYTSLPGMLLYDAIAQGKPWPIRAAWFTSYNFVNQAAHPNRIVQELFPKLELIVVSEHFMTATADQADYVLPATTFYEAEDLVLANDHLYVQLQQKVVEPPGECRHDLEMFGELSRRMGLGHYFDKTPEGYLQDLLSSGDPLLEGITLDRLREEGAVRMNLPRPFVPFVDRSFPTPSGRAEFYSERLVEIEQELPGHLEPLEGPSSALGQNYPLTFLTTHSRFSANSQHFSLPHVAARCPEPFLEINPGDARARGIGEGDEVEVFNDRGRCRVRARVTEGIRPGVVNAYQGWWPKDFIAGSQQSLTQGEVDQDQAFIVEANWAIFDCAVEVRRA